MNFVIIKNIFILKSIDYAREEMMSNKLSKKESA